MSLHDEVLRVERISSPSECPFDLVDQGHFLDIDLRQYRGNGFDIEFRKFLGLVTRSEACSKRCKY
jgi:hypothetical protein